MTEETNHPTIGEVFSCLNETNSDSLQNSSGASIAPVKQKDSPEDILFVVYQEKRYRISDQRIGIGRVPTADLRVPDLQVSFGIQCF